MLRKPLLAAFISVGALLCTAAAPAATGAPFVERFANIDDARWRVSDGWTNGDWTANDWRASQIALAPGGIDVTLARTRGGEKRFSSGELQSEDVFRYGYFEARMRVPRGSGLVTGFFTYTRPGAENTWDEIDIEILGRDTHAIQFSYFRRGQQYNVTVPLGFDAAEGEHSYGFEWTAARLRWFVDGRVVHEERGENGPLPQATQRLYLHLWNTETLTDWLGPILPWEGPWRLHVSCIAHAESYAGRPLCE